MAEWLAMVAEHAAALRGAGVLEMRLPDGGVIRFAPQAEPEARAKSQPRDLLNPLDDPATFGGRLPGYDLTELERDA